MREDEDFLGKEPVGKLLLKLALPTVTAQLINMLYNIVDRIYIGHIPVIGEAALTGVGVCMPLIMIVTAFAALLPTEGRRGHPFLWDRANTNRRKRRWGTALWFSLSSPFS